MKAYAYSQITKEYIEEVDCQPNPLEGGFLLPANATFEEPPVSQEKQIAVWNDGWEIKDDCRNEKYWDKTTREEMIITEIDVVKDDNWTELEPISGRCIWEVDNWIEPPLTPEEQEAQDEADYIIAMPDVVKTLTNEIEDLKARIIVLEG